MESRRPLPASVPTRGRPQTATAVAVAVAAAVTAASEPPPLAPLAPLTPFASALAPLAPRAPHAAAVGSKAARSTGKLDAAEVDNAGGPANLSGKGVPRCGARFHCLA